MIKFEALYYPCFEPSANWLRGFLLFFDRISTIVPIEANYNPSSEIEEIIDAIPDGFRTISPKYEDISLDDLNFDRMRRAFELIKKGIPKNKEKTVNIIFTEGGEISVDGHVFLHERKISEKIGLLLEEFKLIRREVDFIPEIVNANQFHIVNNDASNLILSYIADRVARRYGMNTITDHEMGFIVNALDGLEGKASRDPESLLARSIINSQVPEELYYLDINKYKQIRAAYTGIREAFKRVVIDLNNFYQLNKIEDRDYLHEKIIEIAEEFNSEFEKFKKSKVGRNIKRWASIGIRSLPVILGSILSKSKLMYGAASLRIGLDIIEEYTQPKSNKINLFKMMGKMQGQVLRASKVKNMMIQEHHFL